MNERFRAIGEWIENEVSRTPYGEIVVTIRTHEGRPAIVEKTVTRREKIEPTRRTGVTNDRNTPR